MKKLLGIVVLGLLLSGNAYSDIFLKKTYLKDSPLGDCLWINSIILENKFLGDPKLLLFTNNNFTEHWYEKEARFWDKNENYYVFSSFVDYSGKNEIDLFVFRVTRKEPIMFHSFYFLFPKFKDYQEYFRVKNSTINFLNKDLRSTKENLILKNFLEIDNLSTWDNYNLSDKVEISSYDECEMSVVQEPKNLF